MSWIQLYDGSVFDFENPEFTEKSIISFAISISRIPRFAGHALDDYFVAQHLVETSYICEEYPLEALCHDLPEAVYGDLSSPLKVINKELKEAWATTTSKIDRAFADYYKLTYPWPKQVKYADWIMLAREKEELMAKCDKKWDLAFPDGVPDISKYNKFKGNLWGSPYAEKMFLKRFYELRK